MTGPKPTEVSPRKKRRCSRKGRNRLCSPTLALVLDRPRLHIPAFRRPAPSHARIRTCRIVLPHEREPQKRAPRRSHTSRPENKSQPFHTTNSSPFHYYPHSHTYLQ